MKSNGRIGYCQICGKEIYIRPCHEGRQKYCSRECAAKSKIKPRYPCLICGRLVVRIGSKCCDRECYRIAHLNFWSTGKPFSLCKICGEEIKGKNQYHKYCSDQCLEMARHNPKRYCPICGKEIEIIDNKFCSRNCAERSQMRKWRDVSGYIYYYGSESPLASKSGRVAEHRQIFWEATSKDTKILELLNNGASVHHRNGKRDDNRIENLELRIDGNHPSGIGESDMIKTLTRLGYKVQEPLWRTVQ